jgi:NADPH:quinone reductase-like Zn-dependent oxidoreductase
MPLAVRFEEYGDVNVLNVVEVPRPVPGAGEVPVQVVAAATNPGEAVIRTGVAHAIFPATFPCGQGSDLAGLVAEVGKGRSGWSVDEEVIGFTDRRASHAEYVIVEADNLVRKPAGVPWDVAGSL